MPAKTSRVIAMICGRKNAPPLFETMAVLGREACRIRIRQAIESLESLERAQSLA
jgi:hypothetical protein